MRPHFVRASQLTGSVTLRDAMRMHGTPTIAYFIDPRFSGGTSSSFAAELAVARDLGHVTVNALSAGLFQGQAIAPSVEAAMDHLGLSIIWDPPSVSGDLVVIHNPIFLSTFAAFPARITARDLVVVAHENFLRPGGHEGFDATGTMDRIDRASLAQRKWIAPISSYNRRMTEGWLAMGPQSGRWRVLPGDWTNIVAGPMQPPTAQPLDRRGRMSRPGPEKFPDSATMDLLFPKHALANVILGADALLRAKVRHRHWTLMPFGSVPVDEFFGMIDFMLHFTAPTLRESFGRAIAEAIVAGKVVISDSGTAEVFGDAVVAAEPGDVDRRISALVRNPTEYAAQVRRGQAAMGAYSADALRGRIAAILSDQIRVAS
jgi:hypothetical protein